MGAPMSMRNTQCSGALETSANIKANQKDKSGVLCGVLVFHSASTDDPVVTIYDTAGTTVAGTVLFACTIDASEHWKYAGVRQIMYNLPDVVFKLGCYVSIANASAVYVYFR